jgi:hypothetical protein
LGNWMLKLPNLASSDGSDHLLKGSNGSHSKDGLSLNDSSGFRSKDDSRLSDLSDSHLKDVFRSDDSDESATNPSYKWGDLSYLFRFFEIGGTPLMHIHGQALNHTV